MIIAPGLQIVSLAHGTSRVIARERIRAALCELAASALGVAAERVAIQSVPGSAPALLLDGVASAAGISIAHEDNYAFAVFHAHGPVGIDVMRVQPTPDWRAVARDYLGRSVQAQLEGTPEHERPLAFAREWTKREAQLKCLGLPLTEWIALPQRCRLFPLSLPSGLTGTIAVQGDPAGVRPRF